MGDEPTPPRGGGLGDNLRRNAQQFLLLLGFVALLVAFYDDGTGGAEGSHERLELDVAFYKRSEHALQFFRPLREALDQAFDRDGFELTCHEVSSPDNLFQGLDDGTYDIAGELSPTLYVQLKRAGNHPAFLGIEYDGAAYYHSVLFVPDEARVDGIVFEGAYGVDNLSHLEELLEAGFDVVHEDDMRSTSGYYYPRSYMLEAGFPIEQTKGMASVEQIYKKVLTKEDNGYVAGFMADFRLEALMERHLEEGNRRFEECATPLVIDKSDPIPNGVFVMSSRFAKRVSSERLEQVKRLWKTVRGVDLGNGRPEITGWRDGVERDLELVEYHMNRVDYDRNWKADYNRVMTAIVAIAIIVLGVLVLLVNAVRDGRQDADREEPGGDDVTDGREAPA